MKEQTTKEEKNGETLTDKVAALLSGVRYGLAAGLLAVPLAYHGCSAQMSKPENPDKLAHIRYGPEINKAAEKYGIDPTYLASHCGVESEFNHYKGGKVLVSPSGDVGLCQLQPITARNLGFDPYDKQQNADAAAKLLGILLKKYDGNTTKASAAYHLGEPRIDKGLYRTNPKLKERAENYVSKVHNMHYWFENVEQPTTKQFVVAHGKVANDLRNWR